MRLLRLYQFEQIHQICQYLAEGQRRVILQGPTGSGKSTIVTYLIGKVLRTTDFDRVVVAVPQTQIQSGFEDEVGQWGVSPTIKNGTIVVSSNHLGETLSVSKGWQSAMRWWAPSAEKDSILDHVQGSGPTFALCVTHAKLRNAHGRLRDAKLKGLSLKGKLLVIDEAHHASIYSTAEEQTKLGEAADLWVECGGTVLYVTATPFRGDKVSIAPADTPIVARSMLTHASEGFSPSIFKTKVVLTGREPAAPHAFYQNMMTQGAEAYVEEWESQGRPFTVMLTPSRESVAWGGYLESLLREKGARVLNVVGTSNEPKEALINAVTEIKQLLRTCKTQGRRPHVDEVEFQVIIAAARFDEGTDYPPMSHIFCSGISGSLPRSIQRLGRTTRAKRDGVGNLIFEGYNPEHADTANITFFLDPSCVNDGEEEEQFRDDFHSYVMRIACFLGHADVGSHLTTQRIRFTPRVSDNPIVDALAGLAVKPPPTDGATEQALQELVQEEIALTLAEGAKPTVGMLVSEDPVRNQVLLDQMWEQATPADRAALEAEHMAGVEAGEEAARGVIRAGGGHDAAMLARSRVGDECLRETLLRYGHHTLSVLNGVLTQFTSAEAERIVQDIVDNLCKLGALTMREACIYQAVEAFQSDMGRPPGPTDLLEFDGVPFALGTLDRYVRNGYTSVVAGRTIHDIYATGKMLAGLQFPDTREGVAALLHERAWRAGRLLPPTTATSLPVHRLHELRSGWVSDLDTTMQVVSHALYHGWGGCPVRTRVDDLSEAEGLLRSKARVAVVRAQRDLAPWVTNKGLAEDERDAFEAKPVPAYVWSRVPTTEEHRAAAICHFLKKCKLPDANVQKEDATPYYSEAVRADNPGTFLWQDCFVLLGCTLRQLVADLTPLVSQTDYDAGRERFRERVGRDPKKSESAYEDLGVLRTWKDAEPKKGKK